MANPKRAVLISGCSDGGMGTELAKEFHRQGLHVYATARDTSKMASLTALGIETLSLDIQSESSIAACVEKIDRLDILVNNAGACYTMPIVDISLPEAKKLFDLNVWGHLALTQAFMPLLLESSKAMVVNHTSIAAGFCLPFQATYNASKAAMAMFSDALRLELQPFDIAVINLKTGAVRTNIIKNVASKQPELPQDSIYTPAKAEMETALRGEWAQDLGIPPEQWAREVVSDLLRPYPPPVIWRGESARLARVSSFFPFGWLDGSVRKMTGLDKIETIIRGARR